MGRVSRVLAAARSYLAAHGVPQRLVDLASNTVISASGLPPVPQWRFNDAGKPLLQRVYRRLRTTTKDSAMTGALAGLGIARLLSCQVAAHLCSGVLRLVLAAFETAPLPVHVAHHEGRHAPQNVSAFVDLAVDTLRDALAPR